MSKMSKAHKKVSGGHYSNMLLNKLVKIFDENVAYIM